MNKAKGLGLRKHLPRLALGGILLYGGIESVIMYVSNKIATHTSEDEERIKKPGNNSDMLHSLKNIVCTEDHTFLVPPGTNFSPIDNNKGSRPENYLFL